MKFMLIIRALPECRRQRISRILKPAPPHLTQVHTPLERPVAPEPVALDRYVNPRLVGKHNALQSLTPLPEA